MNALRHFSSPWLSVALRPFSVLNPCGIANNTGCAGFHAPCLARPLGEQMDLQVRTIRPGCVAEIHRVDLAHSIAPGTAGELWKASDAHAVLSSGTKACLTTYRAAGEERDDGAVGGVMPLSRDSQLANLPSAGHRA